MKYKDLCDWSHVPYHPTWDILDSTKLNAYLECPRKFFYEYVLGWRQVGSKHDLEFGEAWHHAMESLLTYGYHEEGVQIAYLRFLEHYRKHFDESTDSMYREKNPTNVLYALIAYAKQYRDDLGKYEKLYTEVAGSVPVMPEKNIHFRIDAIMRDRATDEVFALEHKTTKRGGRTWVDQWALSIQCGTYAHALYCLYGQKKVYGVRVNGAIFKKENEFQRVPVKKTLESMNVWHSTVCSIIHRMNNDFRLLAQAKPDDPVLEAFALNPTSCTKYWGCAFHDFCTCWGNPLRRIQEPPEGFEVYRWDPSDKDSNYAIDITNEGTKVVPRHKETT